jgi:rRNA-processing protein FCF1
MNLFVKAIGSFYFEHGIYAKPSVMEKLELQVGDPVILIPMDTRNRHAFVDCIFSFDEIDLLNEAVMLLSMFDALACHHYYFLCEFGFTEKVGWTPKQYDYLYEIEPFNIGKEKYERQVFLNLYTKVEEKWLDFTMSLRNEQVEPSLVFLEAKDTEIRKRIEAALINNANLFIELLKEAYMKTDIVVGCGSLLSSRPLPIRQAYLISGLDPGMFAYTSDHRVLTLNPFVFYWLMVDLFKLERKDDVSLRLLKFDLLPAMKIYWKSVPAKKLRLETYCPNKAHIPAFYKDEQTALFNISNILWRYAFSRKKYVTDGELLSPFSAPSIVKEVEAESEARPFLESTPYGVIPYAYGFVIPELSEATEVNIEMYEAPLQNGNSPVILDTNVIDVGYFPFASTSPFFRMFLQGRNVIIPSVVVYELLRKIEVGKEKEKVINALLRLQELNARGLIKLKIIGETPPEIATQEILTGIHAITEKSKAEEIRNMRSDIRDALIIQAALNHNAFIFTNDKKMRTLAFLLGVPSITYFPLVEDVKEILKQLCQKEKAVSISTLIKAVQDYLKETRGETLSAENIKLILKYLEFIDKRVKISHDNISYGNVTKT